MRIFFCWILVGICSIGWAQGASNKGISQTQISFYTEKLDFEYSKSITGVGIQQINDKAIMQFYHTMESQPYHDFLDQLKAYKKAYQLNDWLYYEMMRVTIGKILNGRTIAQRNLLCWFLLSKSGYDTRLTYWGNEVYVYAYTRDELFEVAMITDRGRTYANLSSIHDENAKRERIYILNYIPTPQGKSFSFGLATLPTFRPNLKTKKTTFFYKKERYELDLTIDETLIQIMRHYPYIAEAAYIQVPLSFALKNSLVTQFEKLVENKTDKEVVELIAAFTRSAFLYKEDNAFFGKSKPMVPDELFHYHYSDCEDRCALFYALVKQLLNRPMLIIGYEDHMTIAVALENVEGDAIIYDNEKYYICDPTGPSNSHQIGRIPKGYEHKRFEILGVNQ